MGCGGGVHSLRNRGLPAMVRTFAVVAAQVEGKASAQRRRFSLKRMCRGSACAEGHVPRVSCAEHVPRVMCRGSLLLPAPSCPCPRARLRGQASTAGLRGQAASGRGLPFLLEHEAQARAPNRAIDMTILGASGSRLASYPRGLLPLVLRRHKLDQPFRRIGRW